MPSLVVVGAQWGDEGKGKLVDYLTSNADWVVRFQGGNNAGHTLVVGNMKIGLRLVPSGVLREHTKCVIASGVVASPQILIEEIEALKKAGVSVDPGRLLIDRDVHLVLPYHEVIDRAREERKGDSKLGTTGRGIGPAYEERAARTGVRMAELAELDTLKPRVLAQVQERNEYLRLVLKSETQVTFESVWNILVEAARYLNPYIGNASIIVDGAIRRGERVVFEGAQGTLLDQTFGTVPFVTSSHTLSGAACIGTGIGPKLLDYVLGVVKAYSTRVGSGPFPTELTGKLGDDIRTKGAEFGTVTGRPRRCGWFDAFAVKRAIRLNGVDSIALTKLDVLSGLEKIKICVKYILDGVELQDLPALCSEFERLEPRYIEMDGWEEDITGATKWHQLPSAARLYLSAISEIVGSPIAMVSVGPERDSTIFSSGAGFLRNFVGG